MTCAHKLSRPRHLQEHALRKLYAIIDTAWAETSENVAEIEAIAEDDSFQPSVRHLAAAAASKVRTLASYFT